MKAKKLIEDVGRCLAIRWDKSHPQDKEIHPKKENPWSLTTVTKIKKQLEPAINRADEIGKNDDDKKRIIMESQEYCKLSNKFPELFYYFDGLYNTKLSQSVHPAGMVISPITMVDNYGMFNKDGENCMLLDMDNVHNYTGLAKYDFLVLKTVQVIRDTCSYIGIPYPKTHEIDWFDKNVWNDMLSSPAALFQFESRYSYDCLRKFKPESIFDMSLVTACIRPTGASYRDELLAHKRHKNPSPLIDKLLENNLGYLVYQEDTIAFLQQICGLSGSEADNVRRAIGRKQKDRLEAAMPDILNGFCAKSSQPREIAEQEAKEFLQVIEDSAMYQFGYNHSIAYCLLGYLCAYYRYYYPVEFLTSFLNNAANDDDIKNGTAYATKVGIKITMPKWGFSKGDYFYNAEKRVIAKGLSSIKYMGDKVAEKLYKIANEQKNTLSNNTRFTDVLIALTRESSINSKQLDILAKIDFFSEFGNQREILRIIDMFNELFKKGSVKQISKSKVDGTPLEPVFKKYAVGVTKAGGIAKSYTLLDVYSIMIETEDIIRSMGLPDLSDVIKVQNFADAMGYVGYVSNKEEDRPKLYVLDIYQLRRKRDNKQFGYSVITKSIGSGIETRFTVFNRLFDLNPIKKGDIIFCKGYRKEGQYFTMTAYDKIA